MIYIIIIAIILAGEQRLKHDIEERRKKGEEKEILGGRIILSNYHNTGAMLNLLKNKKELLIGVSGIMTGILLVLFAITLPKKGKRMLKIGSSLMLGGASSNLLDRLKRGYVVDYFSIKWKPIRHIVFNLADIAIFLGGMIIAIGEFLRK